MNVKPGISVVVPVFRSVATLALLHRRLVSALEEMAVHFEIIFVEDGATDTSWTAIQSLARDDDRVVGIRLSRNYGQHNALLCGIRAACYSIIVTMDDDLQHPPEEIYKLLEKLDEHCDVVYGTPEREQHNFWRDQASRITKIALQGAMGAETARHASAFRIFRTRLRNSFCNFRGPFVSIDVLLTWGTTRFSHIAVRHEPRMVGVSNYSVRKLFNHAMNMMTGFSTIPLQLASMIGFCFTLLGLGILAYVLGRYLIEGVSVPGFAFLASIIAIFSGAQLFTTGIIGEYLARMHFRTMERPAYIVADTVMDATQRDENALSNTSVDNM